MPEYSSPQQLLEVLAVSMDLELAVFEQGAQSLAEESHGDPFALGLYAVEYKKVVWAHV